jgi:CheY-like chemotaxis protein
MEPQPERGPGPDGAQLAILVVDDDAAIRRLVGRMVQRFGLDVFEADDGQRGLELLQRHGRVACVILDLHMPGVPGPVALRAMREARPALPVVLISGNPEDADRVCAGDPLTTPLLKPFTVAELREALRCVLGHGAIPG